MSGYYLMHRGWMDNPAFKREKFTEREAWEWMISQASFEPSMVPVSGVPTLLKTGSFSHSVRFMANAWQWDKMKVIRYIQRLANLNMLELCSKSDTAQNIITICNYVDYQNTRYSDDTKVIQHQKNSDTKSKTLSSSIIESVSVTANLFETEVLPAQKASKGSRISESWVLTKPLGAWAIEQGLTEQAVRLEAERFKNYWLSVSGAKGIKRDWAATWRNWILSGLARSSQTAAAKITKTQNRDDKVFSMEELDALTNG